jgi:hypothetical protein
MGPLADSDIRPLLRARLRACYAREAGTVVLDELAICRGQVRVDLAVVNGLVHGYEIKSDRDTLERLATQTDFYGRVLDRATLVVGDVHLQAAARSVPRWWEVWRVDSREGDAGFTLEREGAPNPQRDPRALVEFLWREDALALLEKHDAARGMRGKTRLAMWDRICQICDVEEIAAAARVRLKSREERPGPALSS